MSLSMHFLCMLIELVCQLYSYVLSICILAQSEDGNNGRCYSVQLLTLTILLTFEVYLHYLPVC